MYLAIASSSRLDCSGKMALLTPRLRQELNQKVVQCFRGAGQWYGDGDAAHFLQGPPPDWSFVSANLEAMVAAVPSTRPSAASPGFKVNNLDISVQ